MAKRVIGQKGDWPGIARPLSYTAIRGNQRKSRRMGQFGMGQPVRRLEDQRLVTGHGRYTDDISLAHQAYAYVLRSPHAHARIRGIDTKAAEAAPGVLADARSGEHTSGLQSHSQIVRR